MTRPLRILVIGDRGQVGWELQRSLATLGTVVAAGRHTSPHRADLTDPDGLRRLVREVAPDWVVNAAAYTAVDKAEEEQELAYQVNATAPGVIADEAARLGAPLIHYSTDYVFDGTANTPYTEVHPTAPQNVYGASKLAGEQAVAAAGGEHLILRTSWVYGNRGQNFLHTMLRLGRERETLRVVADQHGSPTWSRAIAEATAQLIAKAESNRRALPERSGVYHLSCGGQTSWHGFAEAIFDLAAEPMAVRQLEAITTAEYPTPAQRPAYSVLSNRKIGEAFGIFMPDWEQALRLCLDRD